MRDGTWEGLEGGNEGGDDAITLSKTKKLKKKSCLYCPHQSIAPPQKKNASSFLKDEEVIAKRRAAYVAGLAVGFRVCNTAHTD